MRSMGDSWTDVHVFVRRHVPCFSTFVDFIVCFFFWLAFG